MNEPMKQSRSVWAAVLLYLTGCHSPVNDLSPGALDAGAPSTVEGANAGDAGRGSGTGGGGGGGGGSHQLPGDALCDQSQCLLETTIIAREGIARLTPSGPEELLAMGLTYTDNLKLGRIDLTTGATTHVFDDRGHPLDNVGRLRLQGPYVYLLTTLAGELWGIPARIRLADGHIEELLSHGAENGNPVERAHDVDTTDYVFSEGTQLLRLPLSAIPGTATPLVTLAAGEQVADLRLGTTHVWWATQTGLYRAPRSGGAPERIRAGAFTRLELSGDEVWVGGATGLARWTNTGFTTLTTAALEDFALARGTWFVAVRSGTTVRVLDAFGAVVLEDTDSSKLGRPASLVVTATRVALATGTRLLVKSAAPAVSACGCARPTPTLPSAAPACERAFCGGGQRSEGLAGGTFVGDALFGVFREPRSSDVKLKRVDATSSGGAALVFDLLSTQASVASDATAVFAVASGGLWAVDAATGATRSVLSDTWTAHTSRTPGAPMLAIDATHAFVVDSSRGVGRVERAGGTWQQLLPSSRSVDGIRLDATHLYVSRNNELLRVPKGGGAVEVLARGLLGDAGFDLDHGYAYFLTARGLERVATDGGFKSLVLTHDELGVTRLSHLAVQGRELVFVSFRTGDADSRLERLDLSTRARETLLTVPTASSLSGVVITPDGVALGGYTGSAFRVRNCCP
jgi:hypothetical protein